MCLSEQRIRGCCELPLLVSPGEALMKAEKVKSLKALKIAYFNADFADFFK